MKMLFTFGGLPHYYNYVLNRLKERGLDIGVIIPETAGKTPGEGVYQTTDDIAFRVIQTPEKRAWYGKPYFPHIPKILAKEQPDILVLIWPYVFGFVFFPKWRRVVKKHRIKLVYKDIPFNLPRFEDAARYYTSELRTENLDAPPKGILFKLYYRLLARLIRRYLTLMDAHVYYSKKALGIIPSYGVSTDKIFIIGNSPDTDRLFKIKEEVASQPPLLPKHNKRIIHVGRLVKWKKVDQLLRAFCLVQAHFPESELIVIGNGPEKKHLMRLADDLGTAPKVTFTEGIYDPKLLGRYLMESSVYVLAGMGGLSINEAMLFGKPVICSVADGTEQELVRDGFNGYFFEENNIEDLAEKIGMLLRSEEDIRLFGARSVHIIRHEVNIGTVLQGYMQAFEYVLKNRIHR